MDYAQDIKYPEVLRIARERDIIVNAVQAGGARDTERVWREIAQMGRRPVHPDPAGRRPARRHRDAVGHRDHRAAGPHQRHGHSLRPARAALAASSRRRGRFAAAPRSAASDMAGYLSKSAGRSGEAITGGGDLVADVAAGRQKLDSVKDEDLPDQLRAMKPARAPGRRSTSRSAERKALNERMAELVKKRDAYVMEQRKKAPAKTADSFDRAVAETLAGADQALSLPLGRQLANLPPAHCRRERFMAIDYEVEYNNRARVPEHPQIFERWERDAAAYRDETGEGRPRRDRPEIRRQPAPDHRPVQAGAARDTGTLALFIHGGYWRSLEPSSFSQMARGMNAHGVTVAVSRLRSLPAGLDRRDHRADPGRLPVSLEAAQPAHHGQRPFRRRTSRRLHGRDRLEGARPGAPADLAPAGYAISGLFDLAAAAASRQQRRLQARRRRGAPHLAAVLAGGARPRARRRGRRRLESSEFLRQSKIIADGWREQGRRDPLRGDRRD